MGWIKGRELWVRGGREPSGVVFVTRRALGTAVVRNRLKRRLRSICRELQPLAGSLVILPQTCAAEAPFRVLREVLTELVAKLYSSCAQ